MSLTVNLGRGLQLRTPVVLASGTFAYGFDAPQVDRRMVGAVVTKGTTARPREGNRPLRIAETPSGMLNAIGLQNPGVDHVVKEFAPRWLEWPFPVIVNVAGDRVDDYVEVVSRLDGVPGISGIELNISCPNVEAGLQFGVDPRLAGELTSAVRRATTLHLMVKLTPNVTDIVAVARAVEEAGADSISAVNTFVGMAIDVERRRRILANGTGGVSGPAIKPLALRAVWEIAGAVHVPVVGIGGISTATDALEFLLAGAVAVQLGTILYVEPQAPTGVCEGIAEYLGKHNLHGLDGLPLRRREVPVHA
jgi:dihydroorotate dehydrogenase (NAD+) catalytic subunit